MVRPVFAILLGIAACSPREQDSVRLRVLTTHDVHGAISPVAYPWSEGRLVGGMAAVAAVMDSAEAECRCPTIRLDGGDQMQGTLESNLTYGASAVLAFNLLGVDAAAVGNHELDWGVDTLLARQREARYPWLAANVYERATGRRPAWARPYAIVNVDEVSVGVVGYLTAATVELLVSEAVAPFEFREGVAGVRDALEAVRKTNPDFVAIVAHAGGECQRDECSGEMVLLARALDSGAVDVIVGGHRHTEGYGIVNGIPIIRAGSSGQGVGVVDLIRRRDGSVSRMVRVDTVFVDTVDPDRAILEAMAPFGRRADSLANRTVVVLRDSLLRRGGEYPLGRLMADAVRAAADADVGLSNRGGIRADLAAGPVSYGALFRVKPFGNTVHRLHVTGRQLMEVVEHAVQGQMPEFVSGIQVRYDPMRPAGNRIVSIELEDGRPILEDGRYTLATSSFEAGGGDGFTTLISIPPDRLPTTVLDALIGHLQNLPQPVVAPANRRIVPITR